MMSDNFPMRGLGSNPAALAIDFDKHELRLIESLLARQFQTIFWDLALMLHELDFLFASHGARDSTFSMPALFSRRGKYAFEDIPKADSLSWAANGWPLSACIKSAEFQFSNLLYSPEEGQVPYRSVFNIRGFAYLTVCWGISLGEISSFDAKNLQRGVNRIDTNGEETWHLGIEPSVESNGVYSTLTFEEKFQLIKNLLRLNYSEDFEIRDKSWLLLDFIYHLEVENESPENSQLTKLIDRHHVVGDIYQLDLPPGL